MPIKAIKKDIKRHRVIDWFAIVVLASAGFVIASILASKIEQFSKDMDLDAQQTQADILNIKKFNTRLDVK